MSNNAIISVGSKQGSKAEDKVEIVSKGKFYNRDGCYYAVYDETQLSGMDGTKTTLKIKEDTFTLIRMGTTNAKIEFKNNFKSISLYNTPYGPLELTVTTNKLSINVNDNGGEVYIDYNMKLGDQNPIRTELIVKINI